MAKALALRERWQLPDRQQPLREFDPPICRRKTQLVVLGHRGRCQRERKFVLAAADLQGQRHQFLPLSASPARGAATGSDRRRLRGATALEHCADIRIGSSGLAAHTNHI